MVMRHYGKNARWGFKTPGLWAGHPPTGHDGSFSSCQISFHSMTLTSCTSLTWKLVRSDSDPLSQNFWWWGLTCVLMRPPGDWCMPKFNNHCSRMLSFSTWLPSFHHHDIHIPAHRDGQRRRKWGPLALFLRMWPEIFTCHFCTHTTDQNFSYVAAPCGKKSWDLSSWVLTCPAEIQEGWVKGENGHWAVGSWRERQLSGLYLQV